ncbi:hypothetical protein C8Q80DRAFT_1139967 [Daedaleopsis nitida]|nr:hypothetical protein C8Q80DRAFT_1139967 [Daedaleopsis nitida]
MASKSDSPRRPKRTMHTLPPVTDAAHTEAKSPVSDASSSTVPNLDHLSIPQRLTQVQLDEEGDASSSSQSSEDEQDAKRLKVKLDPTQPPTTRGTPRQRVFVACHGCRSRRVRCDGAKPVCFNCRRRYPDLESCTYDAEPRRRGIDRDPGRRVRSAIGHRAARKPHPRRRPETPSDEERVKDVMQMSEFAEQRQPHIQPSFEDILQGYDPCKFDPDVVASYLMPPPPPMDAPPDGDEEDGGGQLTVDNAPNMRFARDTWWDTLLVLCSSKDVDPSCGPHALTPGLRSATARRIFLDLRATMSVSVHWANFIYPPRLFETLLDPKLRDTVQPSLLLSMLAVGVLVQGSELKGGARARKRALRLIDHAHSALQASLYSNWLDIGLVQAAWYIAYFEFQGHPEQSWARRRSTMVLLDSLIRLMSLTSLDAGQPQAQYSIFHTHTQQYSPRSVPPPVETHTGSYGTRGCDCRRYALEQQWPAISRVAPLWGAVSMWPLDISEGEVRKEEYRRVVWSSLMLSAGHHCIAVDRGEPQDLSITDCSKYALFLPGEVLARTGLAPIREDNLWNLCIRAMILWQTSTRFRFEPMLSAKERAEFATNAWLEAEAIEAALARHTCDVEGGISWQTRDALSMTKMTVSYELKQYAPQVTTGGAWAFYREKTVAWLHGVTMIGGAMWQRMQVEDVDRRPLFIPWLIGYIMCSLRCYRLDPTLVVALEAAKTLAVPMEYLMRLWPCRDQQELWQQYRYQLANYCIEAGVDPPQAWVPPIVLHVPRPS